jgi:EMC6
MTIETVRPFEETRSDGTPHRIVNNANNQAAALHLYVARSDHSSNTNLSLFRLPRKQNLTAVFLHAIPRCRRILLSLFGGAASGVLRVTGFAGVLFYLFVMLLTSVAVVVKASNKPSKYFLPPLRTGVFMTGVFDRAVVLPYLLAWISFYAMSSPRR